MFPPGARRSGFSDRVADGPYEENVEALPESGA